MSDRTGISTLIEIIRRNRLVLDRLYGYYGEYVSAEMDPDNRKRSDAIVISDVLVNYYTCLETVFLRISQFFENDLRQDKWHQDLLDHMLLSIEGIRTQVVSDEAYGGLNELLKFRHFKRYYFELDYDWDKLAFLRKKLEQVKPLVDRDLDVFTRFLGSLLEELQDEQT